MRKKRALLLTAVGIASVVLALNAAVLAGGKGETIEEGGAPLDCALVLGAGVQPDGTPSWVLHDRLDEALSLYRAGRVKRLLVSGDHRTHEYDEPNAMRVWLEARGVPPADIFMDHAGVDTYSSVWRAKHVFGAERLAIVTQRFHLPRALWVARSMGMRAEGAVADRRVYSRQAWFETREVISRTKAFVDVKLGRTPRHVGPQIPLDGDGRSTAG